MLHLIGYVRKGDVFVFAPSDAKLSREVLEKVRTILAQRLQEIPHRDAPVDSHSRTGCVQMRPFTHCS